jgi:hypothetical protein
MPGGTRAPDDAFIVQAPIFSAQHHRAAARGSAVFLDEVDDGGLMVQLTIKVRSTGSPKIEGTPKILFSP